MKTIQYLLKHKIIASSCLIAIMLASVGAYAYASSQSFYVLNQTPQQGMLMSLTPNPGVMTESTSQNANTLVGVVAPADDTSFSQQAGQVSVRTDGEANALVSTLNGDITVGDRIGPSSILGIGEKLAGSGWIIGTAQASLDSSSKNAVKTVVKDATGAQHTVYVASIPLLVHVSYYTVPVAQQSHVVPESLQSALDKIAGKHVTLEALLVGSLLLIIGIFIAGSVVNSAVKGGLLAISRQPLTKRLIYKNIIQAFGMAALILGLAILSAWLILRFV